MERVFSVSRAAGIVEKFHSEEPGKYIIESLQEVTDLVELNKAQYGAFHHKSAHKFKGENFHHVARIPLTVLFDQNTGLMHDDDALKKWLNDSANAAFRTRPGVI